MSFEGQDRSCHRSVWGPAVAGSGECIGVTHGDNGIGSGLFARLLLPLGAPISAAAQEGTATYGSDEDRIRLAAHFSVSVAALEAMAALPSPEVQVAVASNPATPVEALALMASDHSRVVRSAANEAIDHLADPARDAARALTRSRMQRLRSRLSA